MGDLINFWERKKKLKVEKSVSVYQNRLDTIHEEILTFVIIALIALELFIVFIR